MARPHLLALALLLSMSSLAAADDEDDAPPPPPPQQPMQPMYPAPLSQTMQPSYVPQSVALSGPEEIDDVEDGRYAPPGYTEVHRSRRHLIVGGAVTLGVSYGISAMVAAIGDDARGSDGKNDVASMWVPVAGPFLQLAQTDSSTAKFFLVGLGGAQVAGAIMLYVGMTSKQRVFVRNDLVSNVTITPYTMHGTSGLALTGSF